ncbi:MAG TPA: hypothetical protein VGL42_10050 [Opitutaceae bacterium]|jgi:glucuronoarabinoxylan endo-1,4-beta-xylanase
MTPSLLRGLRAAFGFAASAALISPAVFAGVNVTQNISPGATSWPGFPLAAVGTNPTSQLGVGENFGSGPSFTETFTVPASSSYILQTVDLYVGAGTGTSASAPLTLEIYDLGVQSAPNPSSYSAGVDLLGGGSGLAITYVTQANGLMELDFTGADQVYLQAGHLYAFEIDGTQGTSPMNWYRTTADVYPGGAAYRGRSWINGTSARDFGLAVYANTTNLPPPPTSCSVNLGTTHQTIDGFGAGAVFLDAGLDPLSSSQMDSLFGTGANQIGLTLIRLRVSPLGASDWGTAATDGQMAVSRGARILATPWTPPAAFKSNDNIVAGSLLPSEYGAYASYLNSFTSFMASNGAPVSVISIQNEPDANVTYESCSWTAAQFDTFFSTVGGTIIQPTMMPESESYNQAFSNQTLNDPSAAVNVKYIGGHLYGGSIQDYPLAHNEGKPTWMTEYLINDQTITTAVQTGEQISDCLTTGNMSAYIWWKTIGDANGLLSASGVPQPRAYVMAQFSRFVRPGDLRIDVSQNSSPLGISAFTSAQRGEVSIVAVNNTAGAVNQVFNLLGVSTSWVTPVITSGTQSFQTLAPVPVSGSSFQYNVPATSVVTFVALITPPAPTGLTAVVKSAPVITGNAMVQGSIEMLTGSNVSLGGQTTVSGDLLVPGTPTLSESGNPTFAGVQNGTGSTSPANYTVTLSGNAVLRHLIEQVDPIVLPAVPAPATASNNVLLSPTSGTVTLAPGSYGVVTVNGAHLVLGSASGASAYTFQSLSVTNGGSVTAAGTSSVVIATKVLLNGSVGDPTQPALLNLAVANGGLTVNGGVTVGATIEAPSGTVLINTGGSIYGSVYASGLTVSGTGLLSGTPLAPRNN